MQNQTKAEQVAAWIEENVGKVPELGVTEVGRPSAASHLELGLAFDSGEYVFVTVEQG
jgi:hypothetical protein